MVLSSADRVEILDLIARYNHAIDRSDGPAWAATFVEDGLFEGSAGVPVRGRRALEEFAASGHSRRGAVRHLTDNVLIDGDGDRATLTAYLAMFRVGSGLPELVRTGVYRDTLRRVDGRWKFAHRKFHIDVAPGDVQGARRV